jgi:hypothetical protein
VAKIPDRRRLEHLDNFGVSGPEISFQFGYEFAHRPPLASFQLSQARLNMGFQAVSRETRSSVIVIHTANIRRREAGVKENAQSGAGFQKSTIY